MISQLSLSELSSLVHQPSTWSLALVVAVGFYAAWSAKALIRANAPAMQGGRPNPMMGAAESGGGGGNRGFPEPRSANSIGDLNRIFRNLSKPENQAFAYIQFAERAGVALNPQEMWLLQRLEVIVGATEADLPEALRLSPNRLAGPLANLQVAGLVTKGDESLGVTDEGRAMLRKMGEARKAILEEFFSEWAPGGHYEIQRIIDRFVRQLNKEMPPEQQPA
ncbi:MarR family winged helix-turn-helix transcriptional regulator [Methyloligella sp. 2.7D]|uniref:MarR family winged helix-turn-helix transcriptional regulator n=1 Tax=unclassified Methyloligella TaxID=2625955 RepID=UPI00157C7EBB|nr:MarR family winged helix-turn-helix transcriptional regulator [Methyloligella sp. GL2]QKP77652.1 winged helix-turn-helix transcriptional regulator [Methyloligella sp. GL2]